ncbi:hypothetical protein CWE08_09320 [Aliidiomarina iranensis]|uniref:Uncharacterized protein n=1 Tax=Aliidiomarina iranensis TaxID=1434071 RepID=A0A432VT78_9GAMM|nr:hypothetical protein [Aliidiomarina iranensis]RUO19622.1 hypothetical protein CWE08_09320 [Aliidiomarina iranensis]
MEKILAKQKLWLDLKARHHILRIQAYFDTNNTVLVSFSRELLPKGVELGKDNFTKLDVHLLLMLDTVLNEEFNDLVIDLEVLMVSFI